MKSKITISLCLGLLLLGCFPVILMAQNKDHHREDLNKSAKLKKLVDNYTALNWFNGIVLLSNETKPIYQSTSGFANRDYSIPNSLSTRYNLGFVTQVFTATAIMQLVEAQKIKLKAPLQDYMPTVAKQLPHDVTIHQLLNHTSGLVNYYESNRYQEQFLKIKTLSDLVQFIVKEPMFNKPGHALVPSPSNYVLLAALIEKIADMPYQEYIKKNILTLSDMQDTQLGAWNERVQNKATGYIKKKYTKLQVAPNLWGAHPFGAEGLYSNALDLWKFTQAFFSGKLVAKKQKNMMLRNYEYTEGEAENELVAEDGYSYGWRTKQLNRHKIIYQNSFSPGLNVECRVYDDHERTYTLILLSNLNTDQTEVLANEIDQVICQADYKAPIAAISLLAQKTIEEKGVTYFVTQFDTLVKQYNLSMRQVLALKNVGTYFQEKGDLTTALALFELNEKHFPNNEMVYNDLGSIHLLLENYSASLANFEKHLTLVNNTSGKKRRALTMIGKVKMARAKTQEAQATEVLNTLITEGKSTPATIHTDRFMMLPPPKIVGMKSDKIAQNKAEIAHKTKTEKGDILLLSDLPNKTETTDALEVDTSSSEILTTDLIEEEKAASQLAPQFPGGKTALKNYLEKHLKHPLSKAEQAKLKHPTTIYISFIIGKTGILKNIQVLKSMKDTQFFYDKEALRVVREMPKWEPGTYQGNPVQAYYLLPVEFN